MNIQQIGNDASISELSEVTLIRPWIVQELPGESTQAFFNRFSEDFDGLDRGAQSRLLEEFILSDHIFDKDMAPLLGKLTDEQRKGLADFLVYKTTRRDMPQVLDRCWDCIPESERADCAGHLARSGRDGALMAAPYTDLSAHEIPQKKFINKELKLEQPTKSPLQLYFNDFQSAEEIFTATIRLGRSEHAETLVKYYEGVSKALVIHLLPELLTSGNIGYERARSVLNENWGYWSRVGKNSFFYTPHEKKAIEHLLELAKKVNPDAKGDGFDWPPRLSNQYNQINDDAAVRRADLLLGRFQEIVHLFANPEEKESFLKRVYYSGSTPLAYLDTLQLSPTELRNFLKFLDDEFCEPLIDPEIRDIEQLVKNGKEKFAVEAVLKAIDGLDDETTKHFINHIEKAEALLHPSSFLRIIKAITTKCPELWCQRLDYVADNNVISLDALLLVLSRDDGRFSTSYSSLLEYEEYYDSVKLKTLALGVLNRSPHLVFKSEFVDFVLSLKEKKQFIHTQLAEKSRTTFEEFLKGGITNVLDDPNLAPLKNSLARALRESPSVLAMLSEDGYDWDRTKAFLLEQEQWKILCEHLDIVDLAVVLKEDRIVDDLLNQPKEFRRVRDYLENEGEIAAYRNLVDNAFGFKPERLSPVALGEVEHLKERLFEAAKANPSLLIFNGSLTCPGEEAETFLTEHAEEVAAQAMQQLLPLGEVIDSGVYKRLFQKHIREIALGHSQDGGSLHYYYDVPEDLQEDLAELSPLQRVRDAEEGDAYELLLSECEDMSSYDLLGPRLQALASGETLSFKNGEVSWGYAKPEFLALVKRAAALDASPFFNHYREEIEELPSEKIEGVLKLVELAFIKDLDVVRASTLEEDLEQLRRRLSNLLSETFGVDEFKISGEVDVETISALAVYYNTKCREIRGLKEPGREMVQALALGAFDNWRAWDRLERPSTDGEKGEALLSMQEKKLLPQNLSLTQYESWLGDLTSTGEERLEFSPAEFSRAMRQVFRQAVEEKQLGEQGIDLDYEQARADLKNILDPLQGLEKLREEIKVASKVKGSELEELYRECSREIKNYVEENKEAISRCRARVALSALKEGKVSLNSSGELFLDRSKINVESLVSLLGETYGRDNAEFDDTIGQITRTIQHFRTLLLKGNQGLTLVATDKPSLKAHLLLGERPVTSCQNWDSAQEYNKGLLSYCVDPAVRIVRVYKGEEIVARAVLRLLEDDKGAPALFLEKTYSKFPHTVISDVIAREARRKATSMGVPLYSVDADEDITEEKTVTLRATGSRCAYVYTDAREGLKKNGAFLITRAFEHPSL